jgi:hypothetical protein
LGGIRKSVPPIHWNRPPKPVTDTSEFVVKLLLSRKVKIIFVKLLTLASQSPANEVLRQTARRRKS